jgi:hypothetical protein
MDQLSNIRDHDAGGMQHVVYYCGDTMQVGAAVEQLHIKHRFACIRCHVVCIA